MPGLADQLREALHAFEHCEQPPALIGGLALVAHQVIRATLDVDFLADARDAERIDAALVQLGYVCLYRTDDVANYERGGTERLDVLFARRPHSLRLLRSAQVRDIGIGRLFVVSAEGLIGFKLQALKNDPSRIRDIDDIRKLLRAGNGKLDMTEVTGYFDLFDSADLLRELMRELER
jgi:hypothetical protein